jgi:hypothetical protein
VFLPFFFICSIDVHFDESTPPLSMVHIFYYNFVLTLIRVNIMKFYKYWRKHCHLCWRYDDLFFCIGSSVWLLLSILVWLFSLYRFDSSLCWFGLNWFSLTWFSLDWYNLVWFSLDLFYWFGFGWFELDSIGLILVLLSLMVYLFWLLVDAFFVGNAICY